MPGHNVKIAGKFVALVSARGGRLVALTENGDVYVSIDEEEKDVSWTYDGNIFADLQAKEKKETGK